MDPYLEVAIRSLTLLNSVILTPQALIGETQLKLEREEGDPNYFRRETCVKWLHFQGGY